MSRNVSNGQMHILPNRVPTNQVSNLFFFISAAIIAKCREELTHGIQICSRFWWPITEVNLFILYSLMRGAVGAAQQLYAENASRTWSSMVNRRHASSATSLRRSSAPNAKGSYHIDMFTHKNSAVPRIEETQPTCNLGMVANRKGLNEWRDDKKMFYKPILLLPYMLSILIMCNCPDMSSLTLNRNATPSIVLGRPQPQHPKQVCFDLNWLRLQFVTQIHILPPYPLL